LHALLAGLASLELARPTRPRAPTGTPITVWLLLAVMLIAGLVLPIALIWVVLKRRAKLSDAAWVPLGFQARWYMRGRQYDGEYAGRGVHAWVLPPGRYNGASFGISIGARVESKWSVGPRVGPDFVRELLGREEIPLGPDFAGRVATGADPAGLQALASDPTVRGALFRLSRDRGVIQYLKLAPGEVRVEGMGAVYEELLASPQIVRSVLDDMALVATAAEAREK
jgi:hypothetical protein